MKKWRKHKEKHKINCYRNVPRKCVLFFFFKCFVLFLHFVFLNFSPLHTLLTRRALSLRCTECNTICNYIKIWWCIVVIAHRKRLKAHTYNETAIGSLLVCLRCEGAFNRIQLWLLPAAFDFRRAAAVATFGCHALRCHHFNWLALS